MIYISTSAGSIYAGPDVLPGQRKGKTPQDYNLTDTKGANLVNFVVMPHWGNKEKEKAYLEEKMTKIYNLTDWPYILLSDTQYVEVQDDLYQIVTVAS